MSTRTPFRWGNANFAWDGNPFPNQSVMPFTWDDVALITEIVQAAGNGGIVEVENIFRKEPKKKKRFIELLCTVQGKDIKQIKEIKDYKIFISDIDMVVKEVMAKVEMEL
jgi:hypothetical protein